MPSIIDQIIADGPERRQRFILDVFDTCFGETMRADPDAMRGKFRKMAASAFAFYRGSAGLYYADMARDDDAFLNDQTSRVWIQGDLHAENFGTYMNSAGILVFDVNDFDEAYVGPFTWDLKRLSASLALIGYQKALSDADIRAVIAAAARGYATQVAAFANKKRTHDFALMLANTSGRLLDVLQRSRLLTRVGLLDGLTTIQGYDRRLTIDKHTRRLDAPTRAKVRAAFAGYLDTIPAGKRQSGLSYRIKDIVERRGVGIGSAGSRSFTILVEGPTQALENDVIIYMKTAATAAPSRVVTDPAIQAYFRHNGHRTVVSQRALQAYSDPLLGHTVLDDVGQLVAEVSPYQGDLVWDDVNKLDEIIELVAYLGRAVAKIHCIADIDSDQTLVPFSTDQAIQGVLAGREDAFVTLLVDFGERYARVVRDDHRLFVDAFRNHQVGGL